MATKRGKRPTKKVKSLRPKSLSGGKAKSVRAGAVSAGMKSGATLKIQDRNRFFNI